MIALAKGLEALLPLLPPSAQARLNGLATKLSSALFGILPAVQALKKGVELSGAWLPAITNAASILNGVCYTLKRVIPLLPVGNEIKDQLQAAVAVTSLVVGNAQTAVLVMSNARKAIGLVVLAYTKLCSLTQHIVKVTATELARHKQLADARQGQAAAQQQEEKQEEEHMEEETKDKGKQKEMEKQKW